MNFRVTTKQESTPQARILPFVQDDALTTKLTLTAKRLGINAEWLCQDFKADNNQILLTYAKNQRVIFVGVGKRPTAMTLLKTFRSVFNKYQKSFATHTQLDLKNSFLGKYTTDIVNGVLLGAYQVGIYKTDHIVESTFLSDPNAILEVIVQPNQQSQTEQAIQRAQATAQTQIEMMDLGNKPANYKYPEILAQWALSSGQKHGFKVNVFDEKQCKEMGFEALLAVSKGSEHPPRMIVMEYKHPNASRTVGLVGKGVTFDTGGISIKSSANMHYMKSDMGGAAAVLGTVELVAKLQLPVHVVGIVPTTENSVDGLATKPGDVIGSYAGKTIEVIDTDAEGRLILADALAYLVKNYKTDAVIDLATLTGNCIAALGYQAAAMFTDNEALAKSLADAGQKTGEKLWRLPLWDDYKNELKSDIADLKNYHGKPFAGAIVAAKFLEVFTDKHPAWAHLDIAGMAFDDSEFASQKSATAFGVRLLTEWIES
jgi:leucyl aminopeptidase